MLVLGNGCKMADETILEVRERFRFWSALVQDDLRESERARDRQEERIKGPCSCHVLDLAARAGLFPACGGFCKPWLRSRLDQPETNNMKPRRENPACMDVL